MYRFKNNLLQVLLIHPGGPFYNNKDQGAWSIPKGRIIQGEDYLEAAKREFMEETGIIPNLQFIYLGQITQESGKLVYVWAFEGDSDQSQFKSNTFLLEWPPNSGEMHEFPEVDKWAFFTIAEAQTKIKPSQFELLFRLEAHLNRNIPYQP